MDKIHMMINGTVAIFVACIAGTYLEAAPDLVLVKDGVSLAPIVVATNAPLYTRQAAAELADYIEKTSGVRPQIVTNAPAPLPEHAIWVGYQPVLKTLLPKVDFDFKHPEEILIAANANHLVIAGRDVWDPDHMTRIDERGQEIALPQQECGTVNAVYTFLQDYLGVRWLWPGELGEDVPRKATLAFAPFEYRYHPRIRARSGLLHMSAFSRGAGYGHSHMWTRRQRLQLGSLDLGGGHAFTTWWERFHETHPEYFALQPDGTRSGWPGPRTVKMCLSNPAVWEQWLADVEEQLQEDPTRTIFNASENDGWSSGFCVCENCRAWDHPDGEMRSFNWKGVHQMCPALSDRQVTFANTVARKLKEKYPDKEYYVLNMAYGHSRPAPVEAIPDDNVIIASVTGFWGFDGPEKASPNGTTHGEQITGWAKVAKNLAWRPNTGSPGGWQEGLPDVPLGRMIDNFRYLAERDIMGIFVDSVWEHWGTQGPLYYVMAQLAWDPSRDGHAILEDYYQRGFGPAAKSVGSYWRLMEETRNTFVDTNKTYNIGKEDYPNLAKVYTPELFKRAAALLDKAAAQAGDSEVYRGRVALVRAGLDYTRLAIEGCVFIARYEASGDTDEEAKQKAIEKWEAIDRLREANPLAVNWVSIGGKRSVLTCSFLPSVSPRWR